MTGRRGLDDAAKTAKPAVEAAETQGGIAAKVRQVRQRLFPPRVLASPVDDAVNSAPAAKTGVLAKLALPLPKRSINFQASIAEFFLVNRLRARSQQSKQAKEILERASHIVFVTCKHWFAEEDQKPGRHETRL